MINRNLPAPTLLRSTTTTMVLTTPSCPILPVTSSCLLVQVIDQGPGQKLAALCDLVVQAFDKAGLILPVSGGLRLL